MFIYEDRFYTNLDYEFFKLALYSTEDFDSQDCWAFGA